MSRSYRIKVRETLRRVIRAEDHVRSQLELLDILPQDQMAELLAIELEKQGFQRKGQVAVRDDDGVTITVELDSGQIVVQTEASEKVELKGKKTGHGDADWNQKIKKQLKENLREQLVESLEADAKKKSDALQKQVTDQLEGVLADLRVELDQAVNRATAEALKQKAAQIGQIKEMTDDPESGSLTIVVEV